MSVKQRVCQQFQPNGEGDDHYDLCMGTERLGDGYRLEFYNVGRGDVLRLCERTLRLYTLTRERLTGPMHFRIDSEGEESADSVSRLKMSVPMKSSSKCELPDVPQMLPRSQE